MNDSEIDSADPKKLQGQYKWIAFGASIACVITGFWRNYTYLHYDVGNPALQTQTTRMLSGVSALILTLTLFISLVTGIITVPRWQGFFALVIVVWTVLMGMGA
jgi:hypothetical protein